MTTYARLVDLTFTPSNALPPSAENLGFTSPNGVTGVLTDVVVYPAGLQRLWQACLAAKLHGGGTRFLGVPCDTCDATYSIEATPAPHGEPFA